MAEGLNTDIDKAVGEINELYTQYKSPQVPRAGLPEEISKTPMPEPGAPKSTVLAPSSKSGVGAEDFLREFNMGVTPPRPAAPPAPKKEDWTESPIGYGAAGYFRKSGQGLIEPWQKIGDVLNKSLGLSEDWAGKEKGLLQRGKEALEPTPEQEAGMKDPFFDTIPGQVLSGIIQAPAAVAKYAGAGAAIGMAGLPSVVSSILQFAGVGAMERVGKESALEMVKKLPEDVVMGWVFNRLGPGFKSIENGTKVQITRAGKSLAMKSGVMAGLMGGQEIYDGGDIKQAISSGMVGALLGLFSGREGKLEKGIYEVGPKGKLLSVSQRKAAEKTPAEEPARVPAYEEEREPGVKIDPADRILELFKRSGPEISADELGEHINIGDVQLSMIENGEKNADFHNLESMKLNPGTGEMSLRGANGYATIYKREGGRLAAVRIENPDGTISEVSPKDATGKEAQEILGFAEPGEYTEKSKENIVRKIVPEKITPINTSVPIDVFKKTKPGAETPRGPSSPRLPSAPGAGNVTIKDQGYLDIHKALVDNEGFTFDPKTGKVVSAGDVDPRTGKKTWFTVGEGGAGEVEKFEATPKGIEEFYGTHDISHNLGGWLDTSIDPKTGEKINKYVFENSVPFDKLSDAIKHGIGKDQKAIFDLKNLNSIWLKDEKTGKKVFDLDENGKIAMKSPVRGADFVGIQNGDPDADLPSMLMFNDPVTDSQVSIYGTSAKELEDSLSAMRHQWLTQGTEVLYKGKPGWMIEDIGSERSKGADKDTWMVQEVYASDPNKGRKLVEASADDLKVPGNSNQEKKARIKLVKDKEPEKYTLRSSTKRFVPEGFGEGIMSGTERDVYKNYKPLFDKPSRGMTKRWYAWLGNPGDPDFQPTEPRFERFGAQAVVKGEWKIFNESKASPEELKAFNEMRDGLNKDWAREWGFNRTMPEQAVELDYAAAKELGYDGLNQGDHIGMFYPIDYEEFKAREYGLTSEQSKTKVTPEILTQLKEWGEKLGGKEQIIGFPESLPVSRERAGALEKAWGQKVDRLAGETTLTQIGSLVELARDYMSETGERVAALTMSHEQIHLLKALKLTDEENKLLDRFYPKKGNLDKEEVQAEEIGKILSQGYGKGQLVPQSVKNIIEKISDFIRKLGNSIQGMGYKLSEEQAFKRLISDIANGKVGERPIKGALAPIGEQARIAEDVQKEVKEDFGKAAMTIRGAFDGIKRLYAPGTRGEGARRTVETAGKELASMERSHDVFDKQMEVAEKAFDKMPIEAQYAFSQSASTDATGKTQVTPELTTLRRTFKEISDAKAKEINSFDPDEGLVKVREAYWPGADNAAYQAARGKAQGALPPTRIMEPTGFMKPKDFQEFNDMLNAGYVPTDPNPVRQFRQKMLEWDKFIYTHKMLQQMEQTGDAVKIDSGDRVPTGWKAVPPPYGVTKTGRYIMTDQAAQVFENWLSRPLSSSKYFGDLYRTYMTSTTALQRFQLFGLFHGGFVASEAMISRGALAMKQLYRVMTGQENPTTFIKTALTTPLAALQKYKIGKEIEKEWKAPGTSTDPRVIQAIKDIISGGGGISQEKMFTSYWIDSMRKDFREGKYIAGAIRAPFAGMELIMKPLMQSYVPGLKLGAFEELSTELRRVNPGLTDAQYTSEMHQIWNRIDSRLGQVRWQRIFMNNASKNLVQMLIRAPGWTGGTIAEIGGAPKDAFQFIKEWAKTGKAPTAMPDRVGYVLSLAVGTMMLNAAMSALIGHKDPKDLTKEDYFAFDTGDKDERGNIIRGMLPLYSKDVYAYAKSPASTIWHKANPIIGMLYELSQNKDYYGTGIIDPSKGEGQKIGELGKYLAKAFIPFGERGRERIAEERGTTLTGTIFPAVGIMPAPAYFSQSKATQKALELGALKMPSGGRTKEEYDRGQLLKVYIKKYVNAVSKGESVQPVVEAISKDIQAGKLKKQDIMKFKEKLRGQSLEDSVKKLSLKNSLAVWKVATDDEKRKIVPIIFRHFRNLKDPNEKMEYASEMEKISNDLSKIYKLGGE